MKLIFLLLVLFGFGNAAVFVSGNHQVASRDLNDLLEQFASFIPFEKCKEIVDWYVANDPDVEAAYAFLRSEEFETLTDKVVAMPQYQDFVKYLYDAGVDIYTYQNIFRKILGLPTIAPPSEMRTYKHESGIIKMVNDILNLLPIADIKRWFYDTCLPDPDFQDLLTKLSSQEFRDLVDRIHYTKEYRELTDVLRSQGIDVDELEKAINDFISGHFERTLNKMSDSQEYKEPIKNIDVIPKVRNDFSRQHLRRPKSLKTLVDEFAAFIPIDKVVGVITNYKENDDSVKMVFAFLQGDTFRNLIVKLEDLKELKEFFNWVYGRGVDIYSIANAVLTFIGMPLIAPSENRIVPMAQSGFTHMINDIKEILPMDDIKDWYHHVCIEDKEFGDIIEQLKTDSFGVVVQTVKDDPSFNIIHEGLLNLGVEVGYLDRFLHESFGW